MNLHRVLMHQEWQQCRALILPWISAGLSLTFIIPILTSPWWAMGFGLCYSWIIIARTLRELNGRVAEYQLCLPPTPRQHLKAAMALHLPILLGMQLLLIICLVSGLPSKIWQAIGFGFTRGDIFCCPSQIIPFLLPIPVVCIALAAATCRSFPAWTSQLLVGFIQTFCTCCAALFLSAGKQPGIVQLCLAIALILLCGPAHLHWHRPSHELKACPITIIRRAIKPILTLTFCLLTVCMFSSWPQSESEFLKILSRFSGPFHDWGSVWRKGADSRPANGHLLPPSAPLPTISPRNHDL